MRIVDLKVEAAGSREVSVTATSRFTGKEHTLVLPLSLDAFRSALACWDGGQLIQRAFPTLSPPQREFLMTGVTDEEWREEFGEDDDED